MTPYPVTEERLAYAFDRLGRALESGDVALAATVCYELRAMFGGRK